MLSVSVMSVTFNIDAELLTKISASFASVLSCLACASCITLRKLVHARNGNTGFFEKDTFVMFYNHNLAMRGTMTAAAACTI